MKLDRTYPVVLLDTLAVAKVFLFSFRGIVLGSISFIVLLLRL